MSWYCFHAVGLSVCFFKQKTAYEMRISDWSSDVCSSDLLDADEVAGLIESCATAADGRVPVYLGLSGAYTAKLLETLAATAELAVDGYLVACPYYTRPSQEGLYRHFSAIAHATDRPLIVHTVPHRTAVHLAHAPPPRLALRQHNSAPKHYLP